MANNERIKEVLKDLKVAIKTESALIKRDGNLLFSDFSLGYHTNEVFGVMSATMLGAAKSITAECKKGLPKKIIIQTGNVHIIISRAGSTALLMCMIDAIKDMDRVLSEIDNAIEKIKEAL